MIPSPLPPMIQPAFQTKKTLHAVVLGGPAFPTASVISSKMKLPSTIEVHAQIGIGTASSVLDGALLKVSSLPSLENPLSYMLTKNLLPDSETSIPLAKCDTEQDWYCCPGDPDCDCETGKFAVKLGDSQPSTVTVIGSTSWPGITSTTVAFTDQPLNTDGTTTESTSSTSITSEGSTSATSASEAGSWTGSQAAASATSSDGLNVTATQNNDSSNVGLAAGLGAGLGAAAVVIAGLAFFLIRSRRRKRATATAEKADFGQSETSHLNGGSTPGVSANSQTQYQFYDPQKQVPATPEELPAGAVRERAELSDYGGTGGQRAHERAELGG